MEQYDLIIIGGACAGLSAATYAARRNLNTLVISKDVGGQIATTSTVENYPGIDSITGPKLAQDMLAQAQKWGAKLVYDEVCEIKQQGVNDFLVKGHSTDYQAKTLILAYGKTPRSLGIPGEKEYTGRGVCYCVTCDAPLYKKRPVAVVGGGNSAMEGALILAETSEVVYLIHRRNEFRGESVLLERINANPKIVKVLNAVSTEIIGDGKYVTGLKVSPVPDQTGEAIPSLTIEKTGEDPTSASQDLELKVDGVFIEVGFTVNTELVKDLVEVDRFNQVITNKRTETKTPGVFACGDLTDSPYKQAVISAGEGASAALSAYSYLQAGQPVGVDWSGKS